MKRILVFLLLFYIISSLNMPLFPSPGSNVEGKIHYYSLQPPLKILETTIITREPSNHEAFPSIAQLKNGTYIVVYRKGNSHVDASGAIYYQTSNNLENWSKPKLLIDTELDDRDPSISILNDGTILVNFFMYNCTLKKAINIGFVRGIPNKTKITWRFYSLNDTKNKWVATSDEIKELPNGELMMAAYGSRTINSSQILIYISLDRGWSWKLKDIISPSSEKLFFEPTVSIISDYSFLLVIRVHSISGDYLGMGVAQSLVNGKNWSEVEFLRKDLFNGVAPHLFVYNKTRLFLLYGVRKSVTSILLSEIEKETSGDHIKISFPIILKNMTSSDSTYPSLIKIGKNTYFCVFYDEPLKNGGYFGGIMGIKFIISKSDGLLKENDHIIVRSIFLKDLIAVLVVLIMVRKRAKL